MEQSSSWFEDFPHYFANEDGAVSMANLQLRKYMRIKTSLKTKGYNPIFVILEADVSDAPAIHYACCPISEFNRSENYHGQLVSITALVGYDEKTDKVRMTRNPKYIKEKIDKQYYKYINY